MLILAAIYSFPASAGETLYRWEDDRGHVFFSDIPPINSQIKRQKIIPALDTATHATGTGLRPGERQRLKQIRINAQRAAAEESKNKKHRSKQEAAKTRKAASREKTCAYYQNKIREIDARLRHGCTAAKCARLNERRNDYKRRVSNLC